MKTLRYAALLTCVSYAALAQAANTLPARGILTTSNVQDDTASTIVGMVCSNQAVSITIIGVVLALLAHLGLSITSAMLKKYASYAGLGTQIIRLLAIDVKPPASTIVSNAAEVVAASPLARAAGADPVKMSAAATAIKRTE